MTAAEVIGIIALEERRRILALIDGHVDRLASAGRDLGLLGALVALAVEIRELAVNAPLNALRREKIVEAPPVDAAKPSARRAKS